MNNISQSVDVLTTAPGRRLWSFIGPAGLVAVGYMDPGNWATDIEGGARFGHELLWVLLASNLIAILLQSLAARLGIGAGRDLAQMCGEHYSRPIALVLWGLAEVAIVACDLAEVLGAAIALNLLFSIPIVWGAAFTCFDVLLILGLQTFGVRKLEAVIAVFVLTIGGCLAFELVLARPELSAAAGGFLPHLNTTSLYVAVGILGATVMPHNLYLHSALVRTRRIGTDIQARREALRFNLIDTSVALNVAFLINAAILILAAATFHKHGLAVAELQQAHKLLAPILGTAAASAVFGVALLVSGQSSTITGTLAGQVVMEGFLNLKVSPVIRRFATRILAVVPAVVVLSLYGDRGALSLLVLSQVVLSLQLPFAVIPLIRFTGSQELLGELKNSSWVSAFAWVAAVFIVGLNLWLATRLAVGLGEGSGAPATFVVCTTVAVLGCILLAWIAIVPLTRSPVRQGHRHCLWNA
jgi:manganese transport protein